MHHLGVIYAALYLTGATLAVIAQDTISTTPVWVVLLVPILPVVAGYLLTRSKLKKQDVKVQEIHVLVNSRLSKTLDALAAALIENIALKGRLGIPVTQEERAVAHHVADETANGGGV